MNTQEGEKPREQRERRGRLEEESNTGKPKQCLLFMSHRRFTEKQAQEAD